MIRKNIHCSWVWGLLALLSLTPACSKDPPKGWIARLDLAEGTVRLVQGNPPEHTSPKVGDYLLPGVRLETGPDSRAVLVLNNGGRLVVKPDSVVRFAVGLDTGAVKLALTRGTVEGSTVDNVAASELVISVGSQQVKLGRKAKATVRVPSDKKEAPVLKVEYGQATLEEQAGEIHTVVAGSTLAFSLGAPDAGVAKPDVVPTVTAGELVLFLTVKSRGKVMVQKPDEEKPRALRQGSVERIEANTRIIVPKGSVALVGPRGGQGSEIRGPAELVARATTGQAGAPGALRLVSEEGAFSIQETGKAGTTGSGLSVEGVTVTPEVTHKQVDIAVWREGERAMIGVKAGLARLTGKKRTVIVEAGQRAALKAGTINGPFGPAPAAIQVRQPGTLRVFVPQRTNPVTLRWPAPAAGKGALVEVSRSAGFGRPLFADVIKRRQLTLTGVPRGNLYWRVRPLAVGGGYGEASRGLVRLLPDTSHRRLKGRKAPHNVINEADGNTTVYYQNLLPGFTFTWRAVPGAKVYQFKLFREQNLGNPLVVQKGKATRIKVRSGRLGEGRFLWYVAGRSAAGKLVRSTSHRTLAIRYDNATPNVQILQPRNGQTVAEAQLEVKGITIRGSTVYIDGAAAELDEGYRFTHTVALKEGTNTVLIRVVHPRSGSSLYLRRVIRK